MTLNVLTETSHSTTVQRVQHKGQSNRERRNQDAVMTYVLPLCWWWVPYWPHSCLWRCRSTCGCCRPRQGEGPRCWPDCWWERCSAWHVSAPRNLMEPMRVTHNKSSSPSIKHLCSDAQTVSTLTCLVFILNIIGGDDTVPIKPLCPPEVHTAIFNFSYFQLRWVWGL